MGYIEPPFDLHRHGGHALALATAFLAVHDDAVINRAQNRVAAREIIEAQHGVLSVPLAQLHVDALDAGAELVIAAVRYQRAQAGVQPTRKTFTPFRSRT